MSFSDKCGCDSALAMFVISTSWLGMGKKTETQTQTPPKNPNLYLIKFVKIAEWILYDVILGMEYYMWKT